MKIIDLIFNKNKYGELVYQIKKADTILLFTHVNPDGDALGSLLSLYYAVSTFKSNVYPIILDTVKHDLDFLPDIDKLVLIDDFNKKSLKGRVLSISVDVADRRRLGSASELFFSSDYTIQFDHHPTNDSFANINYIDYKACSTAIIVYRFIKEYKINIHKNLATTLYTGLSTDTGNFAFTNTNSEVFYAMADICNCGLEISRLSYILFRRKELPQQKILAIALSNLTMFCNNRAAYVYVTRDDMIKSGASNEHITTVVNNVVDIEGVDMAFFIHESNDRSIRCSFRCKEEYRVDNIAKKFGGGGHMYASGCSLTGSIEENIAKLCKEVELELNK